MVVIHSLLWLHQRLFDQQDPQMRGKHWKTKKQSFFIKEILFKYLGLTDQKILTEFYSEFHGFRSLLVR
jgi:hypothetical protein